MFRGVSASRGTSVMRSVSTFSDVSVLIKGCGSVLAMLSSGLSQELENVRF